MRNIIQMSQENAKVSKSCVDGRTRSLIYYRTDRTLVSA